MQPRGHVTPGGGPAHNPMGHDFPMPGHSDQLRGVRAMGMPFQSQVEVLPEELIIQIELPAMASMFAGKIREGIEQKVGALIQA